MLLLFFASVGAPPETPQVGGGRRKVKRQPESRRADSQSHSPFQRGLGKALDDYTGPRADPTPADRIAAGDVVARMVADASSVKDTLSTLRGASFAELLATSAIDDDELIAIMVAGDMI